MLLPMTEGPKVSPPLVVLCGHRSGSSPFMSLLEAAGLHLGEVLPPSPANPRGYFENAAIVDINRRLLYEADRDWTCPPARLDYRLHQLDGLGKVAQQLSNASERWGFKDPRTLFTLPAWAAAVGECRLVGVHRNTLDIAKSLARRDGFTHDQALAIALAYAERLASAHRRLGFPIISFDVPPREFLERTRSVAEALGLSWDDDAAERIYDPDLVHHRSSAPQHRVDEYLSAAAEQPIGQLSKFSAGTIVHTWDRLPSDSVEALPRNLGPRYETARSELIRRVLDRHPGPSVMALLEEHPRPAPLAGFRTVFLDIDGLEDDNDSARWSHVVAPEILDTTPPDRVSDLLIAIERRLEPKAIAAIGGLIVDGDTYPTSYTFARSLLTASRSAPPYLHHLDQLAGSIVDSRLRLLAVERSPGGRTTLLLGNHQDLKSDGVAPHEIRQLLPKAHETIATLRDELEELRQDLLSRQEQQRRAEEEQRRFAEGQRQLRRDLGMVEGELAKIRRELSSAEEANRALRRQLEASRNENAALKKSLEKARGDLRLARNKYTRLRNRRTVRAALGLARPFRPLFRAVRGQPVRSRRPTLNAEAQLTEAELADRLRETRPNSGKTTGPLVSVVILTHNGATHLERVLKGLESTEYRDFEVIVVDNASTDGTDTLLSTEWSFPLKTIRNERNTSFSEGNNIGVTAAAGELILFLNNDVDPINPSWLGRMVEALEEDPKTIAAGALLIYPKRGDDRTDLTVQHRGIQLQIQNGPRARNISHTDPLDPSLNATVDVEAATAAALLVRRDGFDAVGGFDTAYVYGAEDVDLCLKLRQHGKIVVVGGAALFHHESSSQNAVRRELTRINRMGNWQHFAEVWGPTLTRTVRRRRLRLAHGPEVDIGVPTVAITLTRNDTSKGWGDYYTAHELGDAFAALGWNVIYAERFKDRWYKIDQPVDLVISLLDAFDVREGPKGAFTIAWIRNWVDRWLSRPWFDSFDMVVCASHLAAEEVAKRSRFDPAVIPLATNPDRFCPGHSVPTFEADFAFTGNNWGVGRKLIPLIDVRKDERFLLFGRGWGSDPHVGRYWRGELSYDLLPDLYRSVKVVLDDTASPTLPHAFVNARVFDAIAAGALVISDNVIGSQEIFDGLLPTYTNRQDLRSALDRYLGDDDLRKKTVAQLRERVLANHTYDKLPERFLKKVAPMVESPKVAFKIGVPDAEQAEKWGDTHFARAMSRALASHGFTSEIHLLPEWDSPHRQDCDVVVHLRGLTTYAPKPAQFNVLWVISHPDDLAPNECDKYDLVLVASKSFASKLATETSVPVVFMPQATDIERFSPQPVDPDLECEVLFVGNSRGKRRPAVDWAIEAGLPLAVYGSGWEGLIPDRYIVAEHFPNDRLSSLYASAKVVLNDHWPDMREHGFVSNRIFDVLAAGGVVVSDRVDGLSELFGDVVPTFASVEELDRVVSRLLRDSDERERIMKEGMERVRAEHSFVQRAAGLADLLRPRLEGRSKDLLGNTFDSITP